MSHPSPVTVSPSVDTFLRSANSAAALAALGGLSSTMSLAFLKLWCGRKLWQFSWPGDGSNSAYGFYSATLSGTGTTQTNAFAALVQSGATAGSRARARIIAGAFEGMGLAESDAVDWRQIDFSVPIVIGFSISIFAATSAGKLWVKIGQSASSDGNISSAGLQLRVENLSLYFGAHNGSGLDESAAQTLSATARQHDVLIVGNGAGSFEFYLDGVLVDTLTGPTAGINFDTRFSAEAFNDTDAANAALWCSAFKVGLLP